MNKELYSLKYFLTPKLNLYLNHESELILSNEYFLARLQFQEKKT